jgi:hypothetical protein
MAGKLGTHISCARGLQLFHGKSPKELSAGSAQKLSFLGVERDAG